MSAVAALIELLRYLRQHEYRFTTVTPATHERVLSRPFSGKPGLRDIFGWSRPFKDSDIEPTLSKILDRTDVLAEREDGRFASKIRVSSLGDDLFLHSAFPTSERDAVFFGPDTYRFVRFVKEQLTRADPPRHVVDMGAGAGAGGIAVARVCKPERTTLVDVNPEALSYARINAAAAGVDVTLVLSGELPDDADLVIANPPYIMDDDGRQYRDGGELLGGAIALDWVRQFLRSREPGRTMLLYAGAAYADGRSSLLCALDEECEKAGAEIEFEEIDPDVFGDELAREAYQTVERIAAIGARIRSR